MYFEEEKPKTEDGQTFHIVCHIQYVSGTGTVYPAHYHSYIEMLYATSGEYEVTLSGKQYRFVKGDMVLINSREVHQIDCKKKSGGEYLVIRFEPEILYSSMFDNDKELQYILPFLFEDAGHQKVIRAAELEDSFVPKLVWQIYKEYEEKEYAYEFAMKTGISEIFLWVFRYFHRKGNTFSISDQNRKAMLRRLQPCLDYVEKHYEEELRSDEMSKICQMSDSYFSRMFHAHMGRTFHDYVNYIRIREAEKMLLTSQKNVTEVAGDVGFSSSSYFIKQFRLQKGISPKQFQKQFGVKMS